MPIYTYACPTCVLEFDEVLPRHDAPPPVCPKCKADVKRLISDGTHFQLTGSGWAAMGYNKFR